MTGGLAEAGVYAQTGRQAGRQTDRQIDRQTDRQTEREREDRGMEWVMHPS